MLVKYVAHLFAGKVELKQETSNNTKTTAL